MEACVDAGEKDEALKYIPKLSDPKEKAEVNHYPYKGVFATSTEYRGITFFPELLFSFFEEKKSDSEFLLEFANTP